MIKETIGKDGKKYRFDTSRRRRGKKSYRYDRQKPKITDDVIYFIQSEIGGPVKIGFTTDPLKRIRDIQACSPFKIDFIGLMNGDMKKEAQLHIRFEHLRIHGEWFKVTDKLLDFIKEHSCKP